MTYFVEETLYYPSLLKKLWKSRKLQAIWFRLYPNLFDFKDFTQAKNQPTCHFNEWFVAIHYFHKLGFNSLVEKYTCVSHERKQEILKKYININSLDESWKTPSLFVYNPDNHSESLFVEVKGKSKNITNYIEDFKRINVATDKPVIVVNLVEVGVENPDVEGKVIIKNQDLIDTSFQENEKLYFQPLLKESWDKGEIKDIWYHAYPHLFKEDEIQHTIKQEPYHFCEWFTAIYLFHTKGYLSLIEKYNFPNYKYKRMLTIFREYVDMDLINQQFEIILGKKDIGQFPDLFVYNSSNKDFMFVEVKKKTKKINEQLNPRQKKCFPIIEKITNKEVKVFQLNEKIRED